MTKVPINYKNALIYKICCNDPNITDIYIGSTTNFYQRKRAHKCNCNNSNSRGYNLHVYKFIRDNGGWENWRMLLLEFYECNNKLELFRREGELIRELKPTLNKFIAGQTLKEYREKNKDKLKQNFKKYRDNNKDKIKENDKKNRDKNKDKIKEILKIYRDKNKDEIKKKNKEYYEKNKDKIKEKLLFKKIKKL